METVNSDFFDLTVLLRTDVLSTRKFVKSGRSGTVGEYFGMLSELLSLELGVKRALTKFAAFTGDTDDCRSLDSMANLLTGMGCDKFVLDFHALLDSFGKKGNWRAAAIRAGQLSEEFPAFHSRIKKARVAARPANLPDESISLADYLALLDEEEANRKPLVLAIDDSPVILQSVAAVLSGDYKVFMLPKPTELEKVLQKLTPELFIIDYKMPEISGFELVPIIRNFPEHKDTPIVFLTSEGTFDNVTSALALGASDFIVKPFNPVKLREKIAKYIVKKKMF